jgi:hypothetical protein
MANPAVDGICEECGFDYERVADDEVAPALRDFGRRYRMPLTRGLKDESLDDIVRAHPTPGVWSALEYACHVRDVFEVQRERLAQALTEDTPTVTPMRRDERVAELRYNEQDREAVADQLDANAVALADAFEALTPEQWDRQCLYLYPDPENPTARDMRWLGTHTVHEGNHHLLDVGRALRTARGR